MTEKSSIRNASWWFVMTAIAVAIIVGVAALQILRWLTLPLAVILLSLTLAAAMEPIISWFDRRTPRWLTRTAAIIIAYLLVFLVVAGLIVAVVPTLAAQGQQLGSAIPGLVERAQALYGQWFGDQTQSDLFDTFSGQLGSLAGTFISLPLTIATSVFGLFLVVFISLYMLIEAPRIRGFLTSLFPKEELAGITSVLHDMLQAMGGYVRGTVINGIVIGIVSVIGLLIIGLDFALVLGLLAGLLELVPVVGPILTGVIFLIFALLQAPEKAWIVLAFVVVLQQAENNLLVPFVMRRQTDISPLLVLLAVFIGGTLGGLLGALVSIPLAAALVVLAKRVIAPAVRRGTGAPEQGQDEAAEG